MIFFHGYIIIINDFQLILMIKSTKERFDGLSEFVKKNHPYDCVEVSLILNTIDSLIFTTIQIYFFNYIMKVRNSLMYNMNLT